MDTGELPLGGIGVDFAGVPPVSHRRTLVFINQFVSHTAHFLNRFSLVCEEKLADIGERIQRLQVTTAILETKLSSIAGLESVTAPTQPTTTTTTTDGSGPTAPSSAPAQSAFSPSAPTTVINQDDDDSDMSDTESVAPAAAVNPNVMTVGQDPRYKKFIQLTKVGVPIVAIRGKMLAEGLDPDLLEDPDQPVPGGGAAPSGLLGGDSSDGDEEDDDDDDESD